MERKKEMLNAKGARTDVGERVVYTDGLSRLDFASHKLAVFENEAEVTM